MKYKKILATVGSLVMLGATMAGAFAASYPASMNAGNTVVVRGTGAGASDTLALNLIDGDLGSSAVGSTPVSVDGGDSFKLEKSSDKFYFNEALNSSYTSLDADELSVGLADGVYDSGDIEDVDYEQSISLGSNVLKLFTDSKYESKEPTVGFNFGNNEKVLSYTIDFDDGEANLTEMPESDMPLLGKEYYVLTATATGASDGKIELLDSANTVFLENGEETTVNGKVVSINWIETNEVILNVDGTNVKKLSEGGIAQLPDGSYVAIKNILSSSRESTTQKVEFSIGSGKIILENGKEVIIGEDSDDKVRNLVATITTDGTYLNGITLTWNSKDSSFLTEANALTMPGFGDISLVYGGLNYDSSSETILLEGGSETLTLEMGNYNIPLMWYNGTDFVQGEEDYPLIIAAVAVTNTTAGYADGASTPWTAGSWGTAVTNASVGNLSNNALSLTEDDRFIVTLIDPDLSDVETLYYQVSEIDVDGANVLVELEDLVGSNDLKWDGTIVSRVGDTDEAGDVTVTLAGFNADNDTVYLEFTSGVTFNKVVSEKGLVVTLPVTNASAITFRESDKDQDVNEGVIFGATVSASTNSKISVTLGTDNVTKVETLSDEKYTAIVKSDLATKLSTDESGDEYDLEIEYFGKEAIADVRVAVGGTVSTTPGEAGNLIVTDTEAASITNKNLIVVGGSAINSMAATLLGVSYPTAGEAFTAATTVGAGEYLVQSFENGANVAVLVAGYNAEDTVKGATYLVNQNPDVAVGMKYVGSTETAASAIVA